MRLGALILFVLVAVAQAQTPGLKFFINMGGVEGIKSIVNPMIEKLSSGVSVPDVHLSAVGIHLDMSAITLNTFRFQSEDVTLLEPWRINIHMGGIFVNMTMAWRYKDGPGIDIRGFAEDIISSTNADILLRLTSANGKLLMHADSVSVSIGNLQITLSGGSSSFYQTIVNMFKGLIKDAMQSAISSNLQSTINTLAADLLSTVPTVWPLDPKMDFDVSLIEESAVHGLHGCYYGNCIFGAGCTDLVQTTFGDIHLANYHSIDVTGYYRAPVSGNFEFQTHYNHRAQLDVNGKTIGKLEPHNPGMCWVQWHTDSTGPMVLEEGMYYPLRLRYQAGCGGGSVSLSVQINGAGFKPVDVLQTYTQPATDLPVVVAPTFAGSASTAVMRAHAAGYPACPAAHHTMPSTPFKVHPDTWMEAYFDQYVLDSVGWTVAQVGYLNVHVDQAMLPEQVPFSLNTSDFSELIPGIFDACPDCAMTMDISPRTAPSFEIHPDGITLRIPLNLNISYVTPRGAPVSAVVLAMPIFAKGAASATPDSRLVGKVESLSCPLSLVSSTVGPVEVEAIQDLLNMILEMVAEPMINQFLEQGLPIPVIQGLSLTPPTYITYFEGYLSVSTRFGYKAAPQPQPRIN